MVWRFICEINVPTLHVFEKEIVVVISIATGTVIRPLRTKVIANQIVTEGPYVDTTTVYYTTTLAIAGMSFPNAEDELE